MTTVTHSYGMNPYSSSNLTGSRIDSIRLLLRITDSTCWELSDEEITFIIDSNPGSVYWQAYKTAEVILGNYVEYITRSMGPLSLNEDQKFQHWTQLAEKMKIAATTGSVQSPYPISSCNGPKKFGVGSMDMYGSSNYLDPQRYDV
jgi:hypothetical protein